MIMEWKRSDDTFHATWRGSQLMLVENPVTKRWYLLADGKLVKQNWPTARKAMNDIEQRQYNQLMIAKGEVELRVQAGT